MAKADHNRPKEEPKKRLHDTLDRLRRYQDGRVALCGKGCAYGIEHVEIQRAAEQCRLKGVFRCGSVWSCPVCAWRIITGRAAEATQAVQWWGMNRVALMTLTIRHQDGEDLRALRSGLIKCWADLQQSRWWRGGKKQDYLDGVRAEIGVQHMIRVQEVTYGWHGWHPHLHVALFIDDKNFNVADKAQRDAMNAKLQERWAAIVEKRLGKNHLPDEHGVKLSPCKREDYISKLGLELAFTPSKQGRGRTQWNLMGDLSAYHKPKDAALWREYSAAYKGCQQLRWSDGLKKLAGIGEKLDEDIAAEDADASASPIEVLACPPLSTWRLFSNHGGAIGRLVKLVDRGATPTEVEDFFVRVLRVREDSPHHPSQWEASNAGVGGWHVRGTRFEQRGMSNGS